MDNYKKHKVSKRVWLQKRALPLFIIILVIGLTIALFLFVQQNPDKIEEFKRYGYPGAFLISLISTSTIILPAPGILLIIALGATLNPVLLGLISAAGGTIGEISGYILGYSGHGFASNNKILIRAEQWMRRRGLITVFLFSLIPILPIDIVGVASGVVRFPIWKFLLACFLGKAILYIVLIQTGAWGWEALLRYIS